MALTPEQRAELEKHGPETVRIKLLQGGADRGASIPGFDTGVFRGLTRSDVEDWLEAGRGREESAFDPTLGDHRGIGCDCRRCGWGSGHSCDVLAGQIVKMKKP